MLLMKTAIATCSELVVGWVEERSLLGVPPAQPNIFNILLGFTPFNPTYDFL
ncbi:MAG: hypothetical protein HC874_18275 [Richelia sp. SL_2_1]|nr:hypothetical protein [Richelia sp. SM1_7_0]NJO29263.1 hypothetical protein [Richelia sp. SL_2_1]